MKTHSEICRTFDQAAGRLDTFGLTVKSDGRFFVTKGDVVIAAYDTVDGLAAFADALDYARGAA